MARKSFKNPFTLRKRIKIAPGISINLSKSGVSATVGVKGASVNIGKKGTYLNAGIPGTGITSRTKISDIGTGEKAQKLDDIAVQEQLQEPKQSFLEKLEKHNYKAEIDIFFSKFPRKNREEIKELTMNYELNDYKLLSKQLELKNPAIVVYISFFVGWLALDRFYIKDRKKGFLKLSSILIPPVLIFWWIIDIFFCYKKVQELNYEKIKNYKF